jgi:uncharacterized protein Yka (UPF0111/DUF47 family)
MDDITKKWVKSLYEGFVEGHQRSDKEIYSDIGKVHDEIWNSFSKLKYLNKLEVDDKKDELIFNLGQSFSKLLSELSKLMKEFNK